MKKSTIRIFTDGCKKAAIKRMFPAWKKMGHSIVADVKSADVQLSSVRIKIRRGLPTVLRLDGIYYDMGSSYNSINSDINRSYRMADAVVYQSHMSKIMCEKYLKKIKTNVHNIIYNGVAADEWCNPKEHDAINIVSCAKWRRWKRLPEIIKVFDKFIEYYPEAKLHIIGPISRGSRIIEHKNVIYHNPKRQIDFNKIKRIYQTMDMCLYLAKKDWCPSSVVETIAAGIPVITTNACGGATEMCKLTKGCVVVGGEKESLEPDYIYKNKYNKMPQEVLKNIVNEMIKITEDGRRVVLPMELTIENVANKYINIMRRII